MEDSCYSEISDLAEQIVARISSENVAEEGPESEGDGDGNQVHCEKVNEQLEKGER